MKKKELYEAPSVETYVIVPEVLVMQSRTGVAGQNDTVNDLTQDSNGNEFVY